MRRNRLLLCFLLGLALLFYGASYLEFQGDVKIVLFSGAWLLFALLAISGNVIGLLYGNNVRRTGTTSQKVIKRNKAKLRQYG